MKNSLSAAVMMFVGVLFALSANAGPTDETLTKMYYAGVAKAEEAHTEGRPTETICERIEAVGEVLRSRGLLIIPTPSFCTLVGGGGGAGEDEADPMDPGELQIP